MATMQEHEVQKRMIPSNQAGDYKSLGEFGEQ
jgi:hypothetical protein